MRTTASRAAVPALVGLALMAADASAQVLPEPGWGLPRDVSLYGHNIDWLLNTTTIFVGLLFAIMCGWMAVACVRYRKDHVPTYEHGDGKKQITMALGISSAIFFIVDGNLFVNSIRDVNTGRSGNDAAYWNFDVPETDPTTVRVEVNARQWGWDFRYAGPDGAFGTADDAVTFNDLRVPIGAPVYLQIGATDVIHSMYLPNFRQKIDAIPGMVNPMWFVATQTGAFDIGCAQHCGVNHYLMKGRITVLEQPEFETWVARASAVSQLAWREDDPAGNWGWAWQEK